MAWNARKLLEHAHHAPVILERVQPRPRQHVAPARGIAVLRLVHVPEQHEVNFSHLFLIGRISSVFEFTLRTRRHNAPRFLYINTSRRDIWGLLNMLEWPRPAMRIIDRYIYREVFSHALLGLLVFTFVFFIPQLVRLMDFVVRHSASPTRLVLLFLCTFPRVFSFTLPISVLVGVLIGLGRMSADSELIAMSALGIGLRRVLVPVGLLAIGMAALTASMTLWASPNATRETRLTEQQLLTTNASFEIQPRVFDERFPHLVLYVDDLTAASTHWRGVFLAGIAADNNGSSELTVAEQAIVIADRQDGKLELHLHDGSTHEYSPRSRIIIR